MITTDLTKRQRLAFDIIERSIKERGYPPTVRDVADAMRIHVHAADYHLKRLEQKGFIRRDALVSRGIAIVSDNLCPHCGQTMPSVQENNTT